MHWLHQAHDALNAPPPTEEISVDIRVSVSPEQRHRLRTLARSTVMSTGVGPMPTSAGAAFASLLWTFLDTTTGAAYFTRRRFSWMSRDGRPHDGIIDEIERALDERLPGINELQRPPRARPHDGITDERLADLERAVRRFGNAHYVGGGWQRGSDVPFRIVQRKMLRAENALRTLIGLPSITDQED